MDRRLEAKFNVFAEDGNYVAYCPALDISSSGKTYDEAADNFKEAFELYVETCLEWGTLEEDLTEHGIEI